MENSFYFNGFKFLNKKNSTLSKQFAVLIFFRSGWKNLHPERSFFGKYFGIYVVINEVCKWDMRISLKGSAKWKKHFHIKDLSVKIAKILIFKYENTPLFQISEISEKRDILIAL